MFEHSLPFRVIFSLIALLLFYLLIKTTQKVHASSNQKLAMWGAIRFDETADCGRGHRNIFAVGCCTQRSSHVAFWQRMTTTSPGPHGFGEKGCGSAQHRDRASASSSCCLQAHWHKREVGVDRHQ